MNKTEIKLFYLCVVLWAISAGIYFITHIPWIGYLMWTFCLAEWVCIASPFVRKLILKK